MSSTDDLMMTPGYQVELDSHEVNSIDNMKFNFGTPLEGHYTVNFHNIKQFADTGFNHNTNTSKYSYNSYDHSFGQIEYRNINNAVIISDRLFNILVTNFKKYHSAYTQATKEAYIRKQRVDIQEQYEQYQLLINLVDNNIMNKL